MLEEQRPEQLNFCAAFYNRAFSAVPSGLVPRFDAGPRLESLGYFRKSSGTLPNREMHLKRQLRPSSTTRPSWEESAGPAHVIAVRLSEGLAHHLFFARRAKKIHEGKPE